MRDDDDEEDEQEGNTKGRASNAVEGVPLWGGDGQRERETFAVIGQTVHKEEEEDWQDHEADLQLIHKVIEDVIIVNVPGEEHEKEYYREEENEVGREG